MVGDTGSAAGSQRQISRFLEVRLKADLDGTRCDLLSYVASILNRLNILKNLSLVQESCISYENRQLQRIF